MERSVKSLKMTLNSQEVKKGNTYLQWTLALLVNLTALSHGFENGWMSPTIILLKSESSPTGHALTDSNIAWIASAMNIAAVFGVWGFAIIADTLGRKRAIIGIALPQVVAWIIKVMYPTVFTLVIARIIGGFAAGGVFIVIPMYVKEISEDHIRGTLGSLLSLAHNTGVLIMYALGGYLDYYTVVYAVVGVPVLITLVMLYAPESPGYLVKREQIDKATEAVACLRGLDKNDIRVQNEVEYMRKTDAYYKSIPQISILTILKDKPWRKGIIIITLAFTLHPLSGLITIVTYAIPILTSTGVHFDISPNLQTLSLPCIMIISALSLTVVVDRFGRKWLLTLAFLVSTVSMFTLGIVIMMHSNGSDVPNWLPVLLMVLALAAYGGGISPLPYIVLSEMFSFQIRARVMGFVVSYAWFVSFVVISTYPLLSTYVSSYIPFFLYGTINLLGAVFAATILPETKGRNQEEIRQLLIGEMRNL